MEGHTPEFERGRNHARLQGHDDHLATINGSIERTAERLRELSEEVRSLRDEARVREERAAAAAEALAAEAKRRRKASGRAFTRRRVVAGLAVGFGSLVLALLAALGVIG